MFLLGFSLEQMEKLWCYLGEYNWEKEEVEQEELTGQLCLDTLSLQ